MDNMSKVTQQDIFPSNVEMSSVGGVEELLYLNSISRKVVIDID